MPGNLYGGSAGGNYLFGGDPNSSNPLDKSDFDSGKLTKYYQNQEGDHPAQRKVDPYMQQWANDANQNQQNDRAALQKIYAQLQDQANGGSTAAQRQMLGGFQTSAQNQQTLANGAQGGAYAQSAARAALTQNAGLQGAMNGQNFAAQQAADKMSAQQQMVQVSAMQRAQDLQAQGMTADDAQRQAALEAQARGMNINYQLGMAGLEGEGIGTNWDAYLGEAGRNYTQLQNDAKRRQEMQGAAMQAGGTAMTAVMSDTRAKKEAAFSVGVQAGMNASPAIAQAQGDYTPVAGHPGYFKHNATGALVGTTPQGSLYTVANGPDTSGPATPDWGPSTPFRRQANEDMQRKVKAGQAKSGMANMTPGLAKELGLPSGGSTLTHNALLDYTKGLPKRMPDQVASPAPMGAAPTPGLLASNELNAGNLSAAMTPKAVGVLQQRFPDQAAFDNHIQSTIVDPNIGNTGAPPDENAALMAAQAARTNDVISDTKSKKEAKAVGFQQGVVAASQAPVGTITMTPNTGPNADPANRIWGTSTDRVQRAGNNADVYEQQQRAIALRDALATQRHAARPIVAGPAPQPLPEDQWERRDLGGGNFRWFKNGQMVNESPPMAAIQSDVRSKNAMAPHDARLTSDALLDALGASQSMFTYKGEPNGSAPRLGVMAQDVEKTPSGRSLVKEDPHSGMKMIDGGAGLSATLASLGRLHERLKKVEGR